MLAYYRETLQINEVMSLEEIEKVLSRYNGTDNRSVKYGKVAIQYYSAFKEYNACKVE